MTLDMMRSLLKRLDEESLYELVFVLLMVHRKEPYVESFFPFALLDRLIDRWEEDHEQILKDFTTHFE